MDGLRRFWQLLHKKKERVRYAQLLNKQGTTDCKEDKSLGWRCKQDAWLGNEIGKAISYWSPFLFVSYS